MQVLDIATVLSTRLKAALMCCIAVSIISLGGCSSPDATNVVDDADSEALAEYNDMVEQEVMEPPTR
ncbi:hypothetical protein LOC67_07605 [Stieleria sp. JC731]|uniref:hypothetical protein n=1 Tax=Pirellulaceae TaxID=2691357 RepID=UPI001E44B4C5|nr:hypothetical protein [Stieleria sp. JC731]MCC9600422.1 hypothetical protein [Stieleria sp. JC731]